MPASERSIGKDYL